jgi:hypothetical protein
MPSRNRGEFLYYAALYASLEVFVFLESKGANLEDSNALHGAASGGPSQLPIMIYLLDRGFDVNAAAAGVPSDGTALTYAARRNNLQGVKLLLSRGADPLISWNGSGTALQKVRIPWPGVYPDPSEELLRELEEAERVALMKKQDLTEND